MKTAALVALALAAFAGAAEVAAAPGDVYVPAHRTGNGLWVPPNVPTTSGGTRSVRKLPARGARTAVAAPVASTSATPVMPPIFAEASPIRR